MVHFKAKQPSGIVEARQSETGSSDSGGEPSFTQKRIGYAIVDGAACASSYMSVMGAETVLAEMGPAWGGTELFTATVGLAACPLLMAADVFMSRDQTEQLQAQSALFNPGGMLAATFGEIFQVGSTEIDSTIGQFSSDVSLFAKALSSPTGLKDYLHLALDAIGVVSEANDVADLLPSRTNDEGDDGEDGADLDYGDEDDLGGGSDDVSGEPAGNYDDNPAENDSGGDEDAGSGGDQNYGGNDGGDDGGGYGGDDDGGGDFGGGDFGTFANRIRTTQTVGSRRFIVTL